MAKFELVSKYANEDYQLPARATRHAAGYDLYAIEDVIIPPYEEEMEKIREVIDDSPMAPRVYLLKEMADLSKAASARPTLVSTGMKVKLNDNEYLELSARSSTPLKYWLVVANGVSIIDADYYNNPDNEGEIFFQLINLGPVPIKIKRGEFIGQGIIHTFEVTEDDNPDGRVRVGGFGSSH